ncbi:MAG: hypothetical protein OXF82_05320 [Gammaproteobacteria bacterium]|nr:hypothetical protein [Gammaproteobacteria bacterium]
MHSKALKAILAAIPFAFIANNVQAQVPDNATHIPYSEIMTVFENLGDTLDQQIRVVDVGDDINVGVGVLRRVGQRSEGEAVRTIVHYDITEVYYVLSGSGILVTGGDATDPVELPPDSHSVTILVGPSGLRTVTSGQEQTIVAGDIVIIPAGVTHGFRHIQDQITYLAVRVDHGQVLPAGYAHPSLD